MRYREIAESGPVAPAAPLTPEQARKRADRIDKAQDRLADAKAASTIKINAEKRKIMEI